MTTQTLFRFVALAGIGVGAIAAWAKPTVTSPAEGATVSLVKAGHKAYLDLPRDERRRRFADTEERAKINSVGYYPEPVKLAWSGATGEVEVKVMRSSDGKVVFVTNAVDLASADVINLEIARAYDWQVSDAEGVAKSRFVTEDYAPRFLQIAGIPNIRDLGGRIGRDGRRVKQGLIYRSGGLNENASRKFLSDKELKAAVEKGGDALEKLLADTCDTSFKPTDVKVQAEKVRRYVTKEGKVPARYAKRYMIKSEIKPGKARLTDATRAYMTEELGIRTDIDLRTDSECYQMTGSPLGPSVKWVHLSSSGYGGMAEDKAKKTFGKVFSVFLDEKNYPIDFHCIAGADRTGAVGFILNALLGVCEEDLYRDWETTGFCSRTKTFTHKDRFDHLVAVFDKYPGETINERVEAYVKSIGFTDEDLAKFRGIMLEN